LELAGILNYGVLGILDRRLASYDVGFNVGSCTTTPAGVISVVNRLK
jgi:hypothetical protein